MERRRRRGTRCDCCELLDVSRSGYYARVDRPAAPKTTSDAWLVVEIRARWWAAAARTAVHACTSKRIERLRRENGLVARQKRRFEHTTDSRHEHPIAPNVLDRKFDVDAANKTWVGDVTYIPTAEGWLYLAVLIDLFSRRVVGWATSATNDRELALRALDQALRARRPRAGLVHRTDRGSPVRQRRLPPRTRRPCDHREHEPHRRLLRQRRR
jgi:putative transposase